MSTEYELSGLSQLQLWTQTNTDAAVLTMADLERAMQKLQEVDMEAMERRANKAAAWAALDLDYDAMTATERLWCALGMEADAVHPKDAERIASVVNRFRRDQLGGRSAT